MTARKEQHRGADANAGASCAPADPGRRGLLTGAGLGAMSLAVGAGVGIDARPDIVRGFDVFGTC